MSATNLSAKLFNLKKGEEKVVMLLITYSFFAGLAYAYFYTASTSLFVGELKITMLPYAYMGQGVVSYFVWLFFKRLQKRVAFSKVFITGGVFLLISVTMLSLGYIFTEAKWLIYVLFVWYNIFLLLNGIGFWGIAAKIFNISQAKRLFGLIGSGEILARVISFLSVPVILKFVKTDDLYYFSIGGLIICLILMPVIVKQLGNQINTEKPRAQTSDSAKAESSGGNIFANKYFKLIFILAFFPLFATFYVDFIFLGQVKIQFVNAKVISGFISLFMGAMSVAEFILRTFVSGRLLTKYGVLFGLLILPVLLAFSTALAAVLGTIYGTVGLFFSFIILSRLFVRVVRTLFFDPSSQILYQPISIHDRLALQSKVEGVSKSIGFIFAGVVLVLLARASFLNVVIYNYIFLAIIAIWIWISMDLYKEYKYILRSVVTKATGTKNKEAAANMAVSEYSRLVDTEDIEQTGIALNLLQRIDPAGYTLLVLKLLPKSPANVQQLILEQLKARRILVAAQILDFCINDERLSHMRHDFEATRKYLTDQQKSSIDVVTSKVNSAIVADRIAVAHLLTYYQNYNNFKLLITLLHDEDSAVRNAALVAAGNIRKRELWPVLIKQLQDERTTYAAALAIRHVGEPIIKDLTALLNKPGQHKQVVRHVIETIGEIKGQNADRVLKGLISIVEPDIRNLIFSLLYHRGYQFPANEHHSLRIFIEHEIETLVWIAAAITDVEQAEGTETLQDALKLEYKAKVEMTFKLLSMIYDPNVISFFIHSFEGASSESRAYAIEVLDMTVSADIKQLILPILSDYTYIELISAYKLYFAQQQLPLNERLTDIIYKDYAQINSWTKAMAVNLLADFPEATEVLITQMLSESKLYSETVLWNLARIDTESLYATAERFRITDRERIISTLNKFETIGKQVYLLTEVAERLKQSNYFNTCSLFELAALSEVSQQVHLDSQTALELTHEDNNIWILLSGEAEVLSSTDSRLLAPGQLVWNEGQVQLRAITNSIILKLPAGYIYEQLRNNPGRLKTMTDTLSQKTANPVMI